MSAMTETTPQDQRQREAAEGAVRSMMQWMEYPQAVPSHGEARSWAKDPHGTLVLLGPTGTGKTWEANGVLRQWLFLAALRQARTDYRMLKSPDFCELARTSRESFLFQKEVAGTSMLLLDDLGAEPDNEQTRAFIFTLIDRRKDSPTIITTNLPEQTWDERWGPRTADRMRQYLTVVPILGESRRRQSGV